MILDQDAALEATYCPSLLPRQVFIPTVRKKKLEAVIFFSFRCYCVVNEIKNLHLSRQSTQKKKNYAERNQEIFREPLWVTSLVWISVYLWQRYSMLKTQQPERLGGHHDQKQHSREECSVHWYDWRTHHLGEESSQTFCGIHWHQWVNDLFKNFPQSLKTWLERVLHSPRNRVEFHNIAWAMWIRNSVRNSKRCRVLQN